MLSGAAPIGAFDTSATAGPDATLLVSNLNDSGAGSLRQAIADANSGAGGAVSVSFAGDLVGAIVLSGGPLEISSAISIVGPGAQALAVLGGNGQRAFQIDAGVTAALSGLTLAGDGITNNGTLTVTDCTLSACSAPEGGAIYNSGTLQINRDTFLNDSAQAGGCVFTAGSSSLSVASSTFSGGSAAGGAAVFDNATGSTSITQSTFSGNSARYGGGGIYQAGSGSLSISSSTFSYNSAGTGGGAISNNAGTGLLSVVNSTFWSNHAATEGGGIENAGTLQVTNCTFADNVSAEGGGIFTGASGVARLNNSLIAKNVMADGATPADLAGSFQGAYNLVGDGAGLLNPSSPNLLGSAATPIDPRIGTFGNYGGPTQTIPLMGGSPAVSAGSTWLCVDASGAPLPADQRGLARITNGKVNIGSYQTQPPLLAGDLNHDATVDLADFTLLSRSFGQTSPIFELGDLDGNGTVNLADLLLLTRNFGHTAPAVSIASPAANATVTGTIPIFADVLPGVAVASVQFQLDGQNLGSALGMAPFSATWNTAGLAGTHTLTAVEVSTAGTVSVSPPVAVTLAADHSPPVVSITAPSSGTPASGTIALAANATDNVAVSTVRFLVDGQPAGNPLSKLPYSLTWNTLGTPNGTHTLSVIATDTSGNTATATRTFTISNPVNLVIDGSQQYQQIDGFGVNLNSNTWSTGNVKPALDTLINQMGARIFRVIVEPVSGWEDTNPNTGPYSDANPNWPYYNQIYSSTKFTDLWNTIQYLNAHGCTVLLNIQGYLPAWMSNPDHTVPIVNEDDWATMVSTMLDYAVNTAHVHVDLLGPMNEPDNTSDPVQGPQVQPAQYVQMLDKLVADMQADGISGIKLVGPDATNSGFNYMSAMFADATLMPLIGHIGIHSYNGAGGSTGDVVGSSGWPGLNWWADEYSDVASGIDMDQGQPLPASEEWTFAENSFQDVLYLVAQGASGAMVWEGLDSFYQLEGNWSTWGMLAYDQATQTYTPRLRLYANGMVDRFVAGGSYLVDSTATDGNLLEDAFANPAAGFVSIVGENTGTTPLTVTGQLTGGLTAGVLQLYETNSSGQMLTRNPDVTVQGGSFSVQIPADTIFALATAPDTSAPSPVDSLTATGGTAQVAVSWSPATDNVAVGGYNLYRASSPGTAPSAADRVATVSGDVTSYTDDVPAGTYYYVVEAMDAAGNSSIPSAESTATATADAAPPTISLQAPPAGANLQGVVTLTAAAFDNVAVAGVQFQLDGVNLGVPLTSAPYTLTWDTAAAPPGSHELTVEAWDASGNVSLSTPAQVLVTNAAVLVAAYSFDAGSGTSLHDDSGHGNNGIINNAVWAPGRFGTALQFSGTLGSFVSVADSPSLDLTGGMTLEAWIDPTALSSLANGWSAVVAKGHTNSSNDVAYALYSAQGSGTGPGGHVLVGNTDSGTPLLPTLALNTWAFLAVTYDGHTLDAFLNGTLVAQASVSGPITGSSDPLTLGGDWSGEMFTGLIDNVRVYNAALTPDQIRADMTLPVGAFAVGSLGASGVPAAPAPPPSLAAATAVVFNAPFDLRRSRRGPRRPVPGR